MLGEIGLEASRSTPCPLCGRDHYCYLVQTEQNTIVKAVCQWTEEAPEGWERVSTAKDGRGVFAKQGYRCKRKHYPDFIQLTREEKFGIPDWKDHLLDMTGDRLLLRRDGKALELAIEYLYPDEQGHPLGKVVRLQWSDRRRSYESNRKTKQIRPWHWVGSPLDGFWSDRGKGDKPWPLYRETEAKEEILRGGIVFAVAGEQAVETYRELGLTATTCQGGEANYLEIARRLKDAFELAKAENLRPVLVIHPDNDITGESKFGEQLLRECTFAKIPAVVMNPAALWPEMPPGGDIWDWVQRSGIAPELILQVLETEIEAAIDRQEEEAKARLQRARWRAPEAWQGELGVWATDKESGDRAFIPKTDFDFQIERELQSDDGGGYLLQVKRAEDRNQRRVFLKSTEYSTAQKFKDALKRALGVGVICNLNNYEVEALLRVRLHEYRTTRKGKSFRLTDRVGQQENSFWVFKDRQFTPTGETCTEDESLWIWNAKLTGEESTLPSPKVADQHPQALQQLVTVMQRAFGSNFYPALLALGYAAAGVHYQEILEKEGAFPTLNLYGDPGSGKTTAAECALSLVGMHQDGMMCDVSLSAAYERLKLAGSLLHCLDDPTRTPELNAFLKGFYNGKARIVRGKEVSFNVQKPHSPMMVTSNHACGENDAATQSRLVRLFFAKATDGERAAFYELPLVQRQASGCLTQLIKLGYPAEEVHALERELTVHLPHAHVRIAKSLALLTCYAMKVAALAAINPQVLKQYVINTICVTVNDPDEGGDSIRDFLEKLFILEAQSKVGEWNLRWIEKGNKQRVLALHLPSIWTALDKDFSPAYNRKVVESLLEAQGVTKTRQRFHRSEDESKAYRRALLTSGEFSTPNTPEEITRWCYELPDDYLRANSEKNRSTRSTEPVEEPQMLTAAAKQALTTCSQPNVNLEDATPPADQLKNLLLDRKTPLTAAQSAVDPSRSQNVNEQKPKPVSVSAPKNSLVDLVDLKNTTVHTQSSSHSPPKRVNGLTRDQWLQQLKQEVTNDTLTDAPG